MSDDNILTFDGMTKLDLPVNRILESAIEADMVEVVVLGYDKDGGYYFASSKGDGPSVLWLLEYSKRRLFQEAESME